MYEYGATHRRTLKRVSSTLRVLWLVHTGVEVDACVHGRDLMGTI